MEQVKLTRVNGALKIDIDGEIFDPLSFKSFRPSARNISDFSKAGLKLFSILSSGLICALGVPYSLFGESWVGDHEYNFDVIDDQIELFMENAPDGYFALMIQLDTRDWWLESHPGAPYSFNYLSQVISSPQWRKDASDYLKAVITHVEEKYGNRFYGYFMLCGFTTEWFSHFDFEESHPIKEKAYREYLNDPTATIPTKEELDGVSGHAFLEKDVSEKIKNYRKFHAELIADSILYFAAEAQSILKHKKLLGVYFGYLFELDGARLWEDGHLAYEKVFTSPDIDMISSPSSYGYRPEVSTSAFMVTYETLDKHNKLYYLEFDHITHLSPSHIEAVLIPGGHSKCSCQRETLNIMQRDFMLCASKGAALWWFDMFEGWFYSDEMMGAITDMIALQKKLSTYKMESVAEVLVVASGEALYGVNKNSDLNTNYLGKQRGGLMRMGAPFDVYSVCDINDIDIDKYKLVIFLDAFEMNDELLRFNEKIKSGGRTILWMYAPDYVEKGIDGILSSTNMNIKELSEEENVVLTDTSTLEYSSLPSPRFFIDEKDITVLGKYQETEKAAIGIKKFDSWNGAYSAVGDLDGATLMKLCELAGVHLYSRDPQVPQYVSSLVKGVYNLKDTVLYVEGGAYIDMFTGKRYVSKDGQIFIEKGEMASKLLVKESIL